MGVRVRRIPGPRHRWLTIAVGRAVLLQGVATMLMDSAEQLVGASPHVGITVVLFDEYASAQRWNRTARLYFPTAGAHAGASGPSAKACGDHG